MRPVKSLRGFPCVQSIASSKSGVACATLRPLCRAAVMPRCGLCTVNAEPRKPELPARQRSRKTCPNLGHYRSWSELHCGHKFAPTQSSNLLRSMMTGSLSLASTGLVSQLGTHAGPPGTSKKRCRRGTFVVRSQSAPPLLAEKSSDMRVRICFSFSDVSIPARIFTVKPTASFVIDPA